MFRIWASDDRKYVIDAPGLSSLHKNPGASKRPGYFYTRDFRAIFRRKNPLQQKATAKKKPGKKPGFKKDG
ncbi:hypothetical protein OKW34_008427 [Paraburkholderia youngii]|uniref:Uncharacterized protein n=1 Tax=Paraburkholderia youngii TaxID=2782701 RepID=A0A7W8L5L4_9BURK|nr:hypothetical protein [Paraburkholderia youngii]MBB5400895.1 hypothetical protein [Paraburkholderia youngii]NUX54143.1 hypothetical protein [Paraburkholderia youngii]